MEIMQNEKLTLDEIFKAAYMRLGETNGYQDIDFEEEVFDLTKYMKYREGKIIRVNGDILGLKYVSPYWAVCIGEKSEKVFDDHFPFSSNIIVKKLPLLIRDPKEYLIDNIRKSSFENYLITNDCFNEHGVPAFNTSLLSNKLMKIIDENRTRFLNLRSDNFEEFLYDSSFVFFLAGAIERVLREA